MHVPMPDLREIVTEMRDAIDVFEHLCHDGADPAKTVEAAKNAIEWAENLDSWLEENGHYPKSCAPTASGTPMRGVPETRRPGADCTGFSPSCATAGSGARSTIGGWRY